MPLSAAQPLSSPRPLCAASGDDAPQPPKRYNLAPEAARPAEDKKAKD